MAITNGYCTLAEFKIWATVRGGTTSTDTNDDAAIEDIVELVSRYLDNATGRRFFKNSTDETRYFWTDDSFSCRVTDLSAAPTTVSVDYDNLRTYTDLSTTLDYELDPPNAALDGKPYTIIKILSTTSSAYFPTGQARAVKVTAKFGFPSVPEDIKNLTLAIAHNVYQARSGQTSGGNITITAAGVVVRPQDVPAWGRQIIAYYRQYQ